MRLITKISMIISVAFLTTCYHEETIDRPLIIKKRSKFNYEVEIPIHHAGRGNVHQLDPSKYEFDDSDWLYVKTDSAKIYANQIILTHERSKIEYPWPQSNLRGYIEIKRNSIKINLTIPIYKDQDTLVDGWRSYEHNGKYKLRRAY